MADVINVVEHGDLILVVGQNSSALRLKVNSRFLRAASKVFEAMFGPMFADGKDLSYNNPKEICLPDDNPAAMEAICKVIHFRNNDVDASQSCEDIWKISQLIDKYMLHEALKYALELWLQKKSASNIRGYVCMLKTALLFQEPRLYKEATKALVKEHASSYFDLMEDDAPANILRAILVVHEKREELRTVFNQATYRAIKSTTSFNSCECYRDFGYDLSNTMSTRRLQPKNVSTKCLTTCWTELTLQVPRVFEGEAAPSCIHFDNEDDASEISTKLLAALNPIKDFEGLDLKDIV